MRAKLLVASLLTALLLGSCTDDHLPQRKMADLIVDLKLAEAYTTSAGRVSPAEREALRKKILADHGVTQQEYDRSLSWYGHNLEEYVKLYDEVDKRLDKRQKKLLASSESSTDGKESSLWPYSMAAMISPKGSQDALMFSIPVSDFTPGERLKWFLRLSAGTPSQMVIGVDYKEGGTSFVSKRFSSDRRLEMTLQTDSTRNVSRIYGYLTVDNRSALPLWADSITLTKLPFAKETYYQYFSQTAYDGPRKPQPKDSTQSRPPTVKPIRDIDPTATNGDNSVNGDNNINVGSSESRPGSTGQPEKPATQTAPATQKRRATPPPPTRNSMSGTSR